MTQKTVLIIEDEEMLVTYLSRALEHAGFRVLAAGDAAHGFEVAEENLPDLILLDILLPGGRGEELLGRLKESPKTEKIPTVVISNLADEETITRCKNLGCVEYLVKADYRLDQLVEKVKAVCTHYGHAP